MCNAEGKIVIKRQYGWMLFYQKLNIYFINKIYNSLFKILMNNLIESTIIYVQYQLKNSKITTQFN